MDNKRLLLSTLILASWIVQQAIGLGATYYYVDRTNGSDKNPGTMKEPFATLDNARTAIRDLKTSTGLPKGGLTVFLRAGIYARTTTFELTRGDSGAADRPIVYRSYPGEHVVISGGTNVTSPWSRYENGIYVTHVGDLSFNSLFVNDMRATRAREPDPPNEGYYYLVKSVDPETSLVAFRFNEGDIDPAWHNLREVEVISCRSWEQSRCRIDRVEGDQVYFQGSLAEGMGYDWNYSADGPGRYYVENVFEGLDTPGEWYLDRQAGDLYYWPLPGEDIHTSEIMAPSIRTIVDIQQSGYITFSNLTFSHADWQLPDGECETDESVCAIRFYWAENCTVEDCVIKHVGVPYAIGCLWIPNKNITIIGNEIYDIGGGGITLCADETQSCIVSDNIIHDIGQVDKDAAGVYLWAIDSTVSHNRIYNGPYAGIVSLARNYQDGLPWKENRIEFNEIHDVMQELNDGGAIDVTGHQPGTSIQYNKIHDIVTTNMHHTKMYLHGIYLDDGAKEFIVRNNLIYRVDNGLLVHNAPNNLIANNIFVDAVTWDLAFSGYAAAEYPRDLLQPGNAFIKNIVYATGNAVLFGVFDELSVGSSDYNLFYAADPGYPNWNLQWWKQTYGFDRNSVEADPLFVDYGNDDFRLQPESPALSLGFEQIDLSYVGPRGR